MSGHVFISYSRNEITFVDSLTKHLEKNGIDVWVDYRDLAAGSWSEQLSSAIQSAEIILVVLSKASVSSENVCKEWSCALNCGKRVILLLFEAAPLDEDLPPPAWNEQDPLANCALSNWADWDTLRECEWIDFREPFSVAATYLIQAIHGQPLTRGAIPEQGIKLPPAIRFFVGLSIPAAVVIFFVPFATVGFMIKLLSTPPNHLGAFELKGVIYLGIALFFLSTPVFLLPYRLIQRTHSFLLPSVVLTLMGLCSAFSGISFIFGILDQNPLIGPLLGVPLLLLLFSPLLLVFMFMFSPALYRWANSARFRYYRRVEEPESSFEIRPMRVAVEYAEKDTPIGREIIRSLEQHGHVVVHPFEEPELTLVVISAFHKMLWVDASQKILPLLVQTVPQGELDKRLQALQWFDLKRNIQKRIWVLTGTLSNENALLQRLGEFPLRHETIRPDIVTYGVYGIQSVLFVGLPFLWMLALPRISQPLMLMFYVGIILLCIAGIRGFLDRTMTLPTLQIVMYSMIGLFGFAFVLNGTLLQVICCLALPALLVFWILNTSRELRLWMPVGVRYDPRSDIVWLRNSIKAEIAGFKAFLLQWKGRAT